MKRIRFKRGSTKEGRAQVVVALLALSAAIALLVIMFTAMDAEEIKESAAMLASAVFLFVLALWCVISGIRCFLNGRKSNEVRKKGLRMTGRIVKVRFETVHDYRNGISTSHNLYKLVFEYTDLRGETHESEEPISGKIYDLLANMEYVPILVYGERAIFDTEKFEADHFSA